MEGKGLLEGGQATLIADSHGKCGILRSATTIVAHGDVEHFRPKSIYWWLAYCYDDHLFACQICNQTYKGENFPVSGKRITAPSINHVVDDEKLQSLAGTLAPDPLERVAVRAFLFEMATEPADLLNPYVCKPESFFKWVADDVLQEVEILPRSKALKHLRAFNAVENFYGLNREELRRGAGRWFTNILWPAGRTLTTATKMEAAPRNVPELSTRLRE